eukprot:Opistho-2@35585
MLSTWVVSTVCLGSSVKERVRSVSKFIKVAHYCRNMSNFNAVFALMGGLRHYILSRMSETWAKVPTRTMTMFKKLETLLDPSRNMLRYRTALVSAPAPVVPMLALITKDLVFAADGNPKTVDDGALVNFERLRLLASVVNGAAVYQLMPYDPTALKEAISSRSEKTGSVTSAKVKLTNAVIVPPSSWGPTEDRAYRYLRALPVIPDEKELVHLCEIRPEK